MHADADMLTSSDEVCRYLSLWIIGWAVPWRVVLPTREYAQAVLLGDDRRVFVTRGKGLSRTIIVLRPSWRKVLRDLTSVKLRTALVVLSVAISVFAIGTILGTNAILSQEIPAIYQQVQPSHILMVTTQMNPGLVESVKHMPEVSAVEGRRVINVRLKTGADRWRNLVLFVIRDYRDLRVDQIQPRSGSWPPGRREILIEQNAVSMINAAMGAELVVEMPDGKRSSLHFVGLVQDVTRFPALLAGTPYGFITFDTLEQLGEKDTINELHVRVVGDVSDRAYMQKVVNGIRDRVEENGGLVTSSFAALSGKPQVMDIIQPILLLLGMLSILSMILSGFLIANTISALLAQQLRQIGVMKAIGAGTAQIVQLYFGMVLIMGLVALVVGVPLSVVGVRVASTYVAQVINYTIVVYQIAPWVVTIQVVVGLGVPLLAAAVPISQTSRRTVREILNAQSLGVGEFRQGWISQFLLGVTYMPRPLVFSLRNMFRRKGRLLLTIGALMLGGAIFMAVFSVRASMFQTLGEASAYWRYDLDISFRSAYKAGLFEREAVAVAGVARAETWASIGVRRVRANKLEGNNMTMTALPSQTPLLRPTVVAGRWLMAVDRAVVVINSQVLRNEPDLKVGDTLVLRIAGAERSFKIVGIVRGVLAENQVYINYRYFRNIVDDVSRLSSLHVVTAQQDEAFRDQVSARLEEHFKHLGVHVGVVRSTGDVIAALWRQFDLVIGFLTLMAFVLALVGGLGLMGTMGINVLDRTREIGVLRAIGASNGAILGMIIAEGVFMSVLSWVAGICVAVVISQPMSDVIGVSFIRAPLSYRFAFSGVLIWLLVTVVVAALASFAPAWKAARIAVRDVLAYE